ncbi:MAG: hypothetical protein ABGW78_10060 [Pirellulales bacterium]
MGFFRSLTLIWPGLPWLWLRGSIGGLVIALAFAVLLDIAILTTWIWSDVVDLQISMGIWTTTFAVWILATTSAVSRFPARIPKKQHARVEILFVEARNAYLAHNWLTAETKLRSLLALAPTDGEAQLMLITMLRRVNRIQEARHALEQLSRSDSGALWQKEINRERLLLEDASQMDEKQENECFLRTKTRAPARVEGKKAA